MLPKVSQKNKQYITDNYGKLSVKEIMENTGQSEHQVRLIAREAGIIKKRRPLVDFSEQLVQVTVSVKRKHAVMAEKDLKQYAAKYRLRIYVPKNN